MKEAVDPQFWSGKKVFLTGHTGFKGGWLTVWLHSMGAKVSGYALFPNTKPNLYEEARVSGLCDHSFFGDIRDLLTLRQAMNQVAPDIVIHMAAQPLVRYSYENPVETYETNVMGTVHLLEAVRTCPSVRAVVIVTTDKCYENKEWVWGYRENEPMGGHDPYSNSKGCAELITAAYRQSFFSEVNYSSHRVAMASARAGNVIGGGDWSTDRLIPDAIAAFEKKVPLLIRNPLAIRPWQHVLEPLSGYLVLAQSLYEQGVAFNGAWNFGPQDGDARTVQEVITLFIAQWNQRMGEVASWQQDHQFQPHEAHLLKLDCSKAGQYLHWKAKWSLEAAVDAIVQWHQAFQRKEDLQVLMHEQIKMYCAS
jgi:CDP-glucose 4,6-dehydratase